MRTMTRLACVVLVSACGGAQPASATTHEPPTSASASADPWFCTGLVDARPAFQASVPAITACYQDRLAAAPTLAGEIDVRMRVASDGTVDLVAVSGSLHDAVVYACVREVVEAIRFPAPTEGTCAVVAVPLDFAPQPAVAPAQP